jgi:hypothetical protein
MNDPAGETPPQPPSEEELRAAYEAELSRITATDMIVQATVSLLNVGAHRVGSEGDLEQAGDAIDAAGALLKILDRRLPANELKPMRDALSQLQMSYARAVSSAGERPAAERPASAPKPGPAEASGRLWVPGR